jgi:hypothetical protein
MRNTLKLEVEDAQYLRRDTWLHRPRRAKHMSVRSSDEAIYEVKLQGRLDATWSDWLNGVTMAFESEEDGRELMVLTGHLDQAGLRGLLTRLWDLNLTVVSVSSLDRTRNGGHRVMVTNAK